MKFSWQGIQRIPVFLFFFALYPLCTYSQSLTLSGTVIDGVTREPITRAIVELLEIGQSKNTDQKGCFQFKGLPPGRYTVSIRHIAYAHEEQSYVVPHFHEDSLVILMHPSLFTSEAVVVQSSRTSSAMNNVPYPVDIALQDRIAQFSAVTVSEALNHVPGVALVRDGTWETAVSIRGLSRSNIISLIDNTRIETANDIAGALSLFNIHDLDRIEILKSSGSVLYGTGALGGVLHVTSKRPLFTDDVQTKAELISEATSVNGGVSEFGAMQCSSDRVTLRLSGGLRNAGNTNTPDGMLPNSQYHDFSVTGSLGIKIIDEQTLFVSYQRSQAENTGIPGGSAFGTSAAVRYTLARRELLGLEYTIPNISTSLPLMTLRLSRQEIDRNVEVLQSSAVTVTPHAVHTTVDAQMESKIVPMRDHLLVVGVEAWERELVSQREKYLFSSNKIIGERPIPASTYFSGGMYAQDEWSLLPGTWTMMLGARYDWIHVSNEKTYNPEYTVVAGVRKVNTADSTLLWNSGTAHDESWSANAGTRYTINAHLDLTFMVATAFRSPSLEERYQYLDLGNGYVQVGNPNLQPERSVCLNSGGRLHLAGAAIQADVFLNQLTNLVTTVPGVFEGRQALINTNIGEARLYGYEVSGEFNLAAWSVLKTSVAYVRGQDIRNHADLPQIAPLNGHIEVSGYLQKAGTITLSCSGEATQQNLAPGEAATAGYAVVDISARSVPWSIDLFSVTLQVGIQNMLDHAYQDHLSTLRGLIKEEAGRNYYLSLTCSI